MLKISRDIFFYRLHVDDHEGGYAGGEDEEHDDDVDHGIPLHRLLVVVPGAAAAQQLPSVAPQRHIQNEAL